MYDWLQIRDLKKIVGRYFLTAFTMHYYHLKLEFWTKKKLLSGFSLGSVHGLPRLGRSFRPVGGKIGRCEKSLYVKIKKEY